MRNSVQNELAMQKLILSSIPAAALPCHREFELNTKRLEILKGAVPKLIRVGILLVADVISLIV